MKLMAMVLMSAFSLPVFSVTAFAGTSRIDPPDPVIDCEFFLTTERVVPGLLKWLKSALVPLTEPDAAFTGYAPTPEAFRALGLPTPYPDRTTMKIESPASEQDPYWLRVYSEKGEELASIPFHFPPVAVWKQVKDVQDEGEIQLASDIGLEDPKVTSVGALLGDFPRGREFIAVRRRMSNLVTVAIGVDVDLRDHKDFTNSPVPHVVGTESGKVLSRIEVIKAHFRVPVPRLKRRGA